MLRVAHVLSETVTAADDDNDTIARMRNNVSPMVGDRGVGDELTYERDRWPPSVSRIVTVVIVVVIVIICLLSIVAVDLLLVVLAANIMLCIYRRHCSGHRRHRATETWRLGLAVTSKRNAKLILTFGSVSVFTLCTHNVRKTTRQTASKNTSLNYVNMTSFCGNDVSVFS